MAERWATFDCYGTLIDWETGIRGALAELWPGEDGARLAARYFEIEPHRLAREALPYRQILARGLRLVAEAEGLPLAPAREGALAESLPAWRAFPEAPAALEGLRERGWRLAVLSNTDPDLLAASLEPIGVPVDETVTFADSRSYKPAHGHWLRFFERTGADRSRHVHVGASLFHDIAPAAELGLNAVWINRRGETSEVPRLAELPDLAALPDLLERLLPSGGA